MKILYFDTETTGVDCSRNEITQFAAIIEIDGVIKEEINWRCQPTRWECVDQGALMTTGITLEQLKTYQPADKMFADIKRLFQKYIPKYTKMPDKFYPAGHNVQFDLDFLNAFFKLHGNADDKQWGITSYQNWRALDSRVFANFLHANGYLNLQDVKLSTLARHFNIDIEAHDALSDIKATRLVQKELMKLLPTKNGGQQLPL
jgi:DNA polymerase III subunit epsilon